MHLYSQYLCQKTVINQNPWRPHVSLSSHSATGRQPLSWLVTLSVCYTYFWTWFKWNQIMYICTGFSHSTLFGEIYLHYRVSLYLLLIFAIQYSIAWICNLTILAIVHKHLCWFELFQRLLLWTFLYISFTNLCTYFYMSKDL